MPRSVCITAVTLIAIVSLLLALTGAAAAPIIFMDSQFNDPDWSASVLAQTTGTAHSAVQDTTDDSGTPPPSPTPGNPAPFRYMTHDLKPATGVFPIDSHIYVFHQYLGGSYDPSVVGGIATIDYKEDQNQFDQLFFTLFNFPSGVYARPALVQGGVVYIAQSPSLSYTHADSWQTAVANGLTAADFDDFLSVSFVAGGDGVFDHPDFSAAGAVIHFGYVRGNSNTGPPEFTIKHGIDNWMVTVTPATSVSEPGALAVFGMGLLCLGFIRRAFLR